MKYKWILFMKTYRTWMFLIIINIEFYYEYSCILCCILVAAIIPIWHFVLIWKYKHTLPIGLYLPRPRTVWDKSRSQTLATQLFISGRNGGLWTLYIPPCLLLYAAGTTKELWSKRDMDRGQKIFQKKCHPLKGGIYKTSIVIYENENHPTSCFSWPPIQQAPSWLYPNP